MKQPSLPRSHAVTASAVFLCALLLIQPLALHDGYHDITLTKAVVFFALAALDLVTLAVLQLRHTAERSRFDGIDGAFALFSLCGICATALSGLPDGYLAPDGRYQGALSMLLYALLFLSLRRFGRFSSTVRFSLYLSSALVALVALGQFFGSDLLGLVALTPEDYRVTFLSTLGNISFFSAFCTLGFGVSAVLLLDAERPVVLALYALLLSILLCAALAAREESFHLAAFAALLALPLLLKEARLLRRVPLLWAFVLTIGFAFSLLAARFGRFPLSALTRLLYCPGVLAAAAILLGLYVLLRKAEEKTVQRVRKIYSLLLFVLLLLALVLLILANTVWKAAVPAALEPFLIFDADWGTDRGREWMSFWQMFRAAPWWRKLIGSGAGSLAAWDSVHRLFPDAITDSAHNEYLQLLLTHGLLGLGVYLFVLAAALRRSWKSAEPVRLALALALLGYSAQAFVNLAQPMTTPLFLVLLALSFSPLPEERARDDSRVFKRVLCAVLALGVLFGSAALSRQMEQSYTSSYTILN